MFMIELVKKELRKMYTLFVSNHNSTSSQFLQKVALTLKAELLLNLS